MIIKVCGMREADNVRQLTEAEAPDLMGLIFYEKSPRYADRSNADLNFFKGLQIPKVGVFVDAEIENILQSINDFGLDYVQLHGSESVAFIQKLKKLSRVRIIKVVKVGAEIDWEGLRPFEPLVDLFLFDTQTNKFGGSGVQFDWTVLESYPLQKGFLLSGGVDEGSVEAIEALASKVPLLLGVDINSRFETSPGVKDTAKVQRFLKMVRG